jgi:hypothetical protein
MEKKVKEFAIKHENWEIIVYFGGEGIIKGRGEEYEINFSMRYLTLDQLMKVSFKNINEIIFFHETHGEKRFKLNF